ncbi:unnamed protein product [Blepharisma stoltei]|uniref:Uncharacterized protein n=1 Tax=Blepharisma stoltei TaxID=1481888 RepID=A0AAU9JV01_9CILI|nr:unnamed protein product [Blepharisma stoltei]
MLKFTRRWLFFSKRRPTIHESVIGRSRFPTPEESVEYLKARDKDQVYDYFEMKKAGRLAPSAYDMEKEEKENEKEAKREKKEYIQELQKKGMKIEYHSSTDEEKEIEELINKDYKEGYNVEGEDVYGKKAYNDPFDKELFGPKKWDEYVKKKKEFEPIKPSEWIENVKPEWEEHIASWNLGSGEGNFNENQDVLEKLEKMADEKLKTQRENCSVISGNAEKSQNIDVLGELEKMADSKKTFHDQKLGKDAENDTSLDIEDLQNIAADPKQKIFEFAALWLKDVEEMHKKLPKNEQNQVPNLGSFLDIASSNQFFKKKFMISDEDLYKKEAEELDEDEDEFENKYKEEEDKQKEKDEDKQKEKEKDDDKQKEKKKKKDAGKEKEKGEPVEILPLRKSKPKSKK